MKRRLDHIKVLRVSNAGSDVDLGLGIVGTPGSTVVATASAANDMAIELLASGNALVAAGAPSAQLSTNTVHTILGCTQMAVAALPNGNATLMLGFGSHTLCATVNASDLRAALGILNAAAAGSLQPAQRAD